MCHNTRKILKLTLRTTSRNKTEVIYFCWPVKLFKLLVPSEVPSFRFNGKKVSFWFNSVSPYVNSFVWKVEDNILAGKKQALTFKMAAEFKTATKTFFPIWNFQNNNLSKKDSCCIWRHYYGRTKLFWSYFQKFLSNWMENKKK
jgi:hypothetical protein